MHRWTLAGVLLAGFLCLPPTRAGEKNGSAFKYPERWVMARYNLLVDKERDQVVELIGSARKSGYTALVLYDAKFRRLHEMPRRYFSNVDQVRRAADEAGLEIIPEVFPLGIGDLGTDPNLAEGLPVVEAPYVVRGNEAVLVPDKRSLIPNGGFERSGGGKKLAGFTYQITPGKTLFPDRRIVHRGKVSCRLQGFGSQNKNGSSWVGLWRSVRPFACYRLSCWVKAEDLAPLGAFFLEAKGKTRGRLALHGRLLEKPTQDWKKVEIVFNSLENREVRLAAGVWEGKSGKVWLDDLKLEELSFVNLLRREGCPLTVASADGETHYEEASDFLGLKDPNLNLFRGDHAGPPLRIAPGSRLREGDALKISWYHPVSIKGFNTMCCLSDPAVYRRLREHAEAVNKLFEPRTFFMGHDEIRVANWCHACAREKRTAGQLLAENVRRCAGMLREINPSARVAVWSDMFDPNHNAVEKYYMVNGSLKGSWNGLPQDVIVVNWLARNRKSLEWFAKRGHPQVLAGYYDNKGNLRHFRDVEKASKGIPDIIGFMYTTWKHQYGDLERYGEALRKAR